MLRLLVGRLCAGLVLLALLTFATYAVFFRIPVDPTTYINPNALPEEQAQIRADLGIDDPLAEQWGRFAWRLGTQADLGTSLLGARQPVNSILKASLPPTLSLVLGGFALTLLLAVPLGMLAALRPRSLLDRGVLTIAVVGVVLHPFLIGLLLRTGAERTGIAPDGGYCPIAGQAMDFGAPRPELTSCGGLIDWLDHMWVPWLTFAFFFLPLYVRMTRSRVLDNLALPYVLTARAKGASERRILYRHVARNALGPLAAMVAVDVATIVTAAIYIETVFGLPGIGQLVAGYLSGSGGYDLHVLVGVVVLVTIAITLANLLSDIIVHTLDPRIRAGS